MEFRKDMTLDEFKLFLDAAKDEINRLGTITDEELTLEELKEIRPGFVETSDDAE